MRSVDYAKTIQWDRSIEIWANGLAENAIKLLEDYLSAIVDHYAPQIETWMKTNRVWTDRTNAARMGLHADVEKLVGETYSIIMDHGDDVEYGVWLELKNQGKYAIIAPALDHWGVLILDDLRKFLK